MNRVWIEPCRDQRALIADSGQPGIDRVHVRLRDSDQSGLVQQTLLEVREEESSVPDDRTADTGAVLSLRQGEFRVREGVGRIEALVAQEAIKAAVHGIGAALGDHIDVATQGAPEFGLASGSDHLKLMDHVETVKDAAEPSGIVIGGKAVDDEVIGKVRWLLTEMP